MDEKKAKDLFDAQIKKKLILKKKSDKEYEAYWIKQKGKECSCITFTTLTHQGQEFVVILWSVHSPMDVLLAITIGSAQYLLLFTNFLTVSSRIS